MARASSDAVDTRDVKPILQAFDEETDTAASSTPQVVTVPAAPFQVTCGHCKGFFVFHTKDVLARCPHCGKASSVGREYAKNRAMMFAGIGLFFLVAGVGVTIGTYELASRRGGIYMVWIGAFIAGILNLIRSYFYYTMTVSSIEGEP